MAFPIFQPETVRLPSHPYPLIVWKGSLDRLIRKVELGSSEQEALTTVSTTACGVWSSEHLAAGCLYGTGWIWWSWWGKGIRKRPAIEIKKKTKVATILEKVLPKSRVLSGHSHPQCHYLFSNTCTIKTEVLFLDMRITNQYLLSYDLPLEPTFGKCL